MRMLDELGLVVCALVHTFGRLFGLRANEV